MTNRCGCVKGDWICPDAERLFRAYRAASDIEATLFDAVTTPPDDNDPILHDRWRLAGEVKRAALRNYERHVDEANDPTPEPRSLRAVS